MKFINKRHTARVVTGNNEGSLDLEIIRPNSGIELKDGKGNIIPLVEDVLSEEPIEAQFEESSTESNRLVNNCMLENNKFKKVALHGAKLGDIVTVKVKYLVE
jgi:hypothetical protein